MTCQTCGNPNQEKFCPNCGEKHHNPHSLSLKHVAEEALEGFTHADHNLARTLRAVLFRPGQLPAEYVAGRRVRYMKPLGFFLVVNLVFFLASTNNAFNQPLSSFLEYEPYTYFGTKQAVDHHLAERHMKLADYGLVFNAAMTSSSKAYLVLLIPLYAFVFSLLFIPVKRTFIEHLLFATYLVGFILLLFVFEALFVFRPLLWGFGQAFWTTYGDSLLTVFTLLALAIYLFLAFRRFYRTNVLWSLLAASLSSLTLLVLIVAYRMVLFYKIIHTGH